MNKYSITTAGLGLFMGLSATSFAADKHVHGEAELFVVAENSTLTVELISPSANLIGFEHEPSTKKQKAIYDKAIHTLEESESVLTLDGGACTLKVAEVRPPFGGEDHHDDHKGHQKGHDDHGKHDDHHDDHKDHKKGHDDHDKHDEHHDHDKHGHDKHSDHHDEHKGHDDHDHDDHSDEVHSDFSVNYQWACTEITSIKAVNVNAFKQFPGIEKLDVKWVTPNQQGGKTLKKDNNSFKLNF